MSAVLYGYGVYTEKYGRKLSPTQIINISKQLPSLHYIKCGYMNILTGIQDYRQREIIGDTRWIGLNIASTAIYPFIYDLVSKCPPDENPYAIEIPMAPVVPVQLLVSVPFDNLKLGEAIVGIANKIPENQRLPGIEGFSEDYIIHDFAAAQRDFTNFLERNA